MTTYKILCADFSVWAHVKYEAMARGIVARESSRLLFIVECAA